MNASYTLKNLLAEILAHGDEVPGRVGTTRELNFVSFDVSNPQDRYITIPYRKVSVPAQIAETMWVLAGRNDTEWLSAYLPQAPKFADDGKHWRAGYGPRLRSFGGSGGTDQLTNVIELLKTYPTTRRAVISLWDPDLDYAESLDIPCNNWLHFLHRDGKLHLNVAIRSNDVMWGWSGINFFEWSVLLEIVANHAGMQVGELHFNVSSLHLYERHYQKARRIVDAPVIATEGHGRQVFYDPGMHSLDYLIQLWFTLEAEIRNGSTVNIETMPEPLLRSWLWAIAYYWGFVDTSRVMLAGLDILHALELSPKRKVERVPVDRRLDELSCHMQNLHTEKSKAYGDSWKKRGEIFSILPNIARKVDRILAQTETTDETRFDTAMDLVIYLAKYSLWLEVADDVTTNLENVRIDCLVNYYGSPRNQAGTVQEETFQMLLDEVGPPAGQHKTWALALLTAEAVGYLVKLWTAPRREAKPGDLKGYNHAKRNATRKWNPEPLCSDCGGTEEAVPGAGHMFGTNYCETCCPEFNK